MIPCNVNNRQFHHIYHLLDHDLFEEVFGDIIRCQALTDINTLYKEHVMALHIWWCRLLCSQRDRYIALGTWWHNSYVWLCVVLGSIGLYVKCNVVVRLICQLKAA